jgi:TRAP-type mannitol/chloroaromatic compound transport system permease small subunit
VEQSRSISEASPDPGGIPLRWLVKSLIPLGYSLLVLQQLAQLVRLLDAPLETPTESTHV